MSTGSQRVSTLEAQASCCPQWPLPQAPRPALDHLPRPPQARCPRAQPGRQVCRRPHAVPQCPHPQGVHHPALLWAPESGRRAPAVARGCGACAPGAAAGPTETRAARPIRASKCGSRRPVPATPAPSPARAGDWRPHGEAPLLPRGRSWRQEHGLRRRPHRTSARLLMGPWPFPDLRCCKLCCSEHRGAYVLSGGCFWFLGMYSWKWGCWANGSCIFNFFFLNTFY